MIKNKVDLSMMEINKRIREIELPDFDLVLGIASGGITPASILSYKLNIPLQIISINYRDETNKPRYLSPKLIKESPMPIPGANILLVDDVSVTGKTIKKAKDIFSGYNITSLVLKGKGDYTLFPEISSCVNWPWEL